MGSRLTPPVAYFFLEFKGNYTMSTSGLNSAIQLESLTKVYPGEGNILKRILPVRDSKNGVVALDQLTMQVPEGSIFGFAGANGAGKSTTLKCILGLVAPTSGSGDVFGNPLGSVATRKIIGFLPEHYTLPGSMTVKKFLLYIASLFGMSSGTAQSQVKLYIHRLALEQWENRKLRTLSRGQAQRVGVAAALINEPKILLFDEPTSGLDPLGRREILELMKFLAKEQGRTVVFSTHILNDVDQICEYLAILDHGQLKVLGKLGSLLSEHSVNNTEALYEKVVGAPVDLLSRWKSGMEK